MIERWIQVAQDQVRSFVALGGPILFGTDVGYMREYDPADEYAHLAGVVLSFAQILAALTTAPAEPFKQATRRGHPLPRARPPRGASWQARLPRRGRRPPLTLQA
jgi:hypothetical protein